MKTIENKTTTLIRIEEDLYEDIKYLASKYNRSINKQIEYMLKTVVEQEEILEQRKNQDIKK